MKIIVINPILFTHEKGVIPHVTTIKETMIYDLCLAYHRAGHAVTLIAAPIMHLRERRRMILKSSF